MKAAIPVFGLHDLYRLMHGARNVLNAFASPKMLGLTQAKHLSKDKPREVESNRG